MRRTLPFALGFALACGGSPPAADPPAAAELPAELPADPPAAAAPAVELLPVPSPGETEAALHQAGLDTSLHDVLPTWNFKFDQTEPNRVAVRTGVLLADLALGASSDADTKLLERLASVRQGLVALGVDGDVLGSIDSLAERIQAKAISRAELVELLDQLAGEGVRRLQLQGSAQLVPLIQAGVWLEGTYCVGEAIARKGDASAADALLKQPAVVDYFLRYAKAEGVASASPESAGVLFESLTKLQTLARRTDPLTLDDVREVIGAADAVLSQL